MGKKFVVRPYNEILNGNDVKEGELMEFGYVQVIALLKKEHDNVRTIEELPQPRKHQAQFNQKVIELINQTQMEDLMTLLCQSDRVEAEKLQQHDKEQLVKGIIITSLISLVTADICSTYGESILDPKHVQRESATTKGGMVGTGSEFFRELLDCINRKVDKKKEFENEMSFERMKTFMQTAYDFIGSHVFKDPHAPMDQRSAAGYKLQHPFSGIQDLDINSYLDLASDVIHEASKEINKRNRQQLQEETKQEDEKHNKELEEAHKLQLQKVREEKEAKAKEESQKKQEGSEKVEASGYFAMFGNFWGPKTTAKETPKNPTSTNNSTTPPIKETSPVKDSASPGSPNSLIEGTSKNTDTLEEGDHEKHEGVKLNG